MGLGPAVTRAPPPAFPRNPRQEYWSGLPFSSSRGIFSTQGWTIGRSSPRGGKQRQRPSTRVETTSLAQQWSEFQIHTSTPMPGFTTINATISQDMETKGMSHPCHPSLFIALFHGCITVAVNIASPCEPQGAGWMLACKQEKVGFELSSGNEHDLVCGRKRWVHSHRSLERRAESLASPRDEA